MQTAAADSRSYYTPLGLYECSALLDKPQKADGRSILRRCLDPKGPRAVSWGLGVEVLGFGAQELEFVGKLFAGAGFPPWLTTKDQPEMAACNLRKLVSMLRLVPASATSPPTYASPSC